MLIFTDFKKIKNVDLKNVIEVKYFDDVKPLTGFIIGGAIGLSLYSAISIIFAGQGEYKFHQDFKDIVIGVSMSTFIGGIIGGLLQKSKPKSVTSDFTGLNINEARKKMIKIFEKGN